MRGAFAIFRNSIKTMMIYRFNFLAWTIMSPIRILIFLFLWSAVFEFYGGETIGFYTFPAMVTYYVLRAVMGGLLHSQAERSIENDVIRGTIVKRVIRPISYLKQIFFWELGTKTMALFIETIPIYLVAYFLVGIAPASLAHLLLFGISLVIAMVINFFMAYTIGLSSFWVKKVHGLKRVYWSLRNFFSGGIIPLDLLPGAVFAFSSLLPFQYLGFVQVGIFTGRYSIGESIGQIAIELIWLGVLYLVSRIIWKFAQRKFMGVGV